MKSGLTVEIIEVIKYLALPILLTFVTDTAHLCYRYCSPVTDTAHHVTDTAHF